MNIRFNSLLNLVFKAHDKFKNQQNYFDDVTNFLLDQLNSVELIRKKRSSIELSLKTLNKELEKLRETCPHLDVLDEVCQSCGVTL